MLLLKKWQSVTRYGSKGVLLSVNCCARCGGSNLIPLFATGTCKIIKRVCFECPQCEPNHNPVKNSPEICLKFSVTRIMKLYQKIGIGCHKTFSHNFVWLLLQIEAFLNVFDRSPYLRGKTFYQYARSIFYVLYTRCNIASKINGTSKGVYLSISKQHSILAVANLLAHNNKSQICYCGQISLQSAEVNCSFSDTFGGNIYFADDGIFCL